MNELTAFFAILAALLLGAMSPGPSFVLVTKLSISNSRVDGLAAAVAMGIGGAIFSVLALVGLTAIFQQIDWLYTGVRILGGCYLIWLAFNIWKGATVPIDFDGPKLTSTTTARSFTTALITQVSNPKTAVVYASIFASLLPAAPSWIFLITLPIAIFVIEAGWYAVVALAFSQRQSRAAYLTGKHWFDRFAGLIMGGLGVRLIWSSIVSSEA